MEVTRVSDHGGDRQAFSPDLERGQERLGDVEGDHFDAVSREFTRDPTRASPNLEDGSPGPSREPLPHREVLGIPTALEVMPNRVEIHGRSRGAGTLTPARLSQSSSDRDRSARWSSSRPSACANW